MKAARLRPAPFPTLQARLAEAVPGLLVAVVIGIAAQAIAVRYAAPVMLIALLLGMAMSFLGEEARLVPGIRLAASTGLKLGVVLMGLRVSVDQLAGLGPRVIVVIVIGSGTTILLGLALGRRMGLSGPAALIASGAVAICGASAALALASVTRDFRGKTDHTLVVILAATALSTFAMIAYPLLLAVVGLAEVPQGVVLGAAIHDVAQVVGAGFSVSEPAGETATLAKMARVTLLPLLMLILSGWQAVRRGAGQGAAASLRLPWFVPAFLLVMLVNYLLPLPQEAVGAASALSGSLLVMAVAALGVGSAPGKLMRAGGAVFTMMAGLSVWLLVVALLGVWLWA
jgi:uncharacterized integral membrane protein (TIGR00698 family)